MIQRNADHSSLLTWRDTQFKSEKWKLYGFHLVFNSENLALLKKKRQQEYLK